MTGGLPRGLVRTTQSVSDQFQNPDPVPVEQISHLWRVYSTNSALLPDDAGERLQNFFWRIWSNPNLTSSLRGHTLARLFTTITDGGNRVRTTPVPTPRPASPTPTHGESTPTPSTPQFSPRDKSLSTSSPPESEPLRPLPPILKTGRAGSEDSAPTARLLWPASPDDNPPLRRESLCSVADTLSPPSPRAEGRGPNGGGRKRTTFIANTGARAKTRPVVRRKSSQGSTAASTETKKSPRISSRRPSDFFSAPVVSPPAVLSPQIEAGPPPTQAAAEAPSRPPPPGLPPPTTTPTSFALPSVSSWQDDESPAGSQLPISQASAPQKPSSWLVDKDFRGKFVETQKRTASQSNLPGLGKSGSTVRFLDDLPARHKEPHLERQGHHHDQHIPQQGFSSHLHQQTTSFDSPSMVDDSRSDASANRLPRTKSQLSVMIDQERRTSGTLDLVLSPQQTQQQQQQQEPQPAEKENRDHKGKRKTSINDGDQSSEDEESGLLMMARKDGVTKAGGLSYGKSMGTPILTNPNYGYRSPTPPLF